ncbi:hypothetical protein OJ996_22355 [Luteolibacter sp. GHJ8]|uniref:Uncharacterized protein n=1 Tax=Luteolibacter rhizosphaerae TaxID=2989719 RepID=A0ABT3G916_9BACT|nr:hypothetical protein [Luteolibacter rhizosphaerae]MCW1916348.1 hypothetical protein [Luteolibacter rhizosphaerae]
MKLLLPLILIVSASAQTPTTQELVLEQVEEQTRLLEGMERRARLAEWARQDEARRLRREAEEREMDSEAQTAAIVKAIQDSEARRVLNESLARLQAIRDAEKAELRAAQVALEDSLKRCEQELASFKDIRPALVLWVLGAQEACTQRDPVFLPYTNRIAGIAKAIPSTDVAKAKTLNP